MDPNIGPIPAEPTRPPSAVSPVRRRERDGNAFDDQLSRDGEKPSPASDEGSALEDDLPVAPPAAEDVGGTLDVTA